MRTDKNGVSTCLAGQENHEPYVIRGRQWVQYEYRSELTGELFSCVSANIEIARDRRDEFLRKEKEYKARTEKYAI